MGELIPLDDQRRFETVCIDGVSPSVRPAREASATARREGPRGEAARTAPDALQQKWPAADPFIAAGATLGFTAATAFMTGAVMVAGGFFAAGAAAISLSTAMAWGSFEVSAYRPRRLKVDPFGPSFAESAGDPPRVFRDEG